MLLHGATKLQNDKNAANQTIAQLGSLNDAQKSGEEALVNGSNTRSDVATQLDKAKALNEAMKNLEKSCGKLLLNKVVITLTIHLNIKMHTIKHYKMPNQSLIKIVILH